MIEPSVNLLWGFWKKKMARRAYGPNLELKLPNRTKSEFVLQLMNNLQLQHANNKSRDQISRITNNNNNRVVFYAVVEKRAEKKLLAFSCLDESPHTQTHTAKKRLGIT